MTDYYPFGQVMPGRSESSSEYRFGLNGIERADKVAGKGNHYTALYGEYNPCTARRWNLDPKPNESISLYSVFTNNPILLNDVLLDTPGVQSWKPKDAPGNPKHGDNFWDKSGNGYAFDAYAEKGGAWLQGLSEVKIEPTKEERNGMAFDRAAKLGFMPPLLEMDADVYVSGQVKRNIPIKGGLTSTIPLGMQFGVHSSDGAYKDVINPIDNMYFNYKNNIFDVRATPMRGLTRGDFNPGVRSLITVGTFKKVAKLQFDMGSDLHSNTYFGTRGVLESPKEIYGVTIPYSLEINAGIRFSKFKWR